MRFSQLELAGAYLIELEEHRDGRGLFARSWCRNEFLDQGLNPELVQCNISYNIKRGTLRGMHWQRAPHEEVKIVRCTQGSIFDVIVDLRPESQTFRSWFGVELNHSTRNMLYIPIGFAHGFQTLTDGAEVFYQMSGFYEPGSACGVRWDDPDIGIRWPVDCTLVSERDQSLPTFAELAL